MFLGRSCCIAVIFVFLLPNSEEVPTACDKMNVWKEAGKMTGTLLQNCLRLSTANSPKQFLIILQECLKHRSLLMLDRVMGRDVIELADGVTLVRYQKENDTGDGRALLPSKNASGFYGKVADWNSQVAERLTQLFTTHVLKIHLKGLNGLQFEGRGRHKHNMFTQLLMFALIAAGVIVIPMGFQFLAILGGKALLLAKMALLMTSIQGLKKIATSNLNYGLYSTYAQGPWHYDRQWQYEADGHGDSYAAGYDPNRHHDILHPRRELT